MRKRSLNTAIVDEPFPGDAGLSQFRSGDGYGVYNKLREKGLRVYAEEQYGCQCGRAVACNAHQFFYIAPAHTRQIGTIPFQKEQVFIQRRRVQSLFCRAWNRTRIILIFFAKRLKTVNLIFRHRHIRVADTGIRPLQSSLSGVKTGTFRHVYAGNFSGHKNFAVPLQRGEQRANQRSHLLTLFRDAPLQVLRVIHAAFIIIVCFIHAKQNDAAVVLIGKTGKRIIEPFRTSLTRRLNLQSLRFTFQLLHRFQ